MTVIVLTDCPKKIRGNLTKWMLEVNTNVFVGQLNKRIRDALWIEICENMPKGKATLIYNREGEQGIGIEIHGNSWRPVDFEGIYMIQRPFTQSNISSEEEYMSKVYRQSIVRNKQKNKGNNQSKSYVAIDLETTGFKLNDEIIEIGAIRFVEEKIIDQYHVYVKIEKKLSSNIEKLTGITQLTLDQSGIDIREALNGLIKFVKKDDLVFHNAIFDLRFLKKGCIKAKLPMIKNAYHDTLAIARKQVEKVDDFKLSTLATYYGIEFSKLHNALDDSFLTMRLFLKLMENKNL
ncbi:exonuclease, DNA polymerase III, epsilon subunit [Firmicutes bacterium M10-2]|nr:exonuclease, DNA polymerase III, epsilon subunit [Firmicutes bacterium M10-2]